MAEEIRIERYGWEPGDIVPMKEDEVKALVEGGPGSGHHGHEGIPGHQGGSRASGAISFGAVEYGNDDHIQKYCKERSQEQAKALTGEEAEAAGAYTNFGFAVVNDCLRNGDCDGGDKALVSKVEGAIGKSVLQQDHVVYRGQSGGWSHPLLGRQPGYEARDRSFTSTSLNPYRAADFAGDKGELHKINLRAGQHGLFMNSFNEDKKDCEILLQRGGFYEYVGVAAEAVAGKVVHEWIYHEEPAEE